MRDLRGAYNIDDLRELARRRLPKGLFEFVDRGAEDDLTLRKNRAAFERIELVPRVLVDVTERKQSVTLFGVEQPSPLIVGPTGATSLLWHKGEHALARAAGQAGIAYTLSTASIAPMEEIAAQQGAGALWFQLYLWRDRALSFEMVERARSLGFKALIVTVDNAAAPNREYNQRNQMTVPMRFSARHLWDGMWHPHWSLSVIARYLLTTGMPTFSNVPRQLRSDLRGKGVVFPRSGGVTWDDLRALRALWPGPLMVKGILHPDDARAAYEHLVTGHAGGKVVLEP